MNLSFIGGCGAGHAKRAAMAARLDLYIHETYVGEHNDGHAIKRTASVMFADQSERCSGRAGLRGLDPEIPSCRGAIQIGRIGNVHKIIDTIEAERLADFAGGERSAVL